MQTSPVAFVQVPEVSEFDVAILYPTEAEQDVPSIVALIDVQPAGTVGFVTLPSRNAQMIMTSPTLWPEGMVIVVPSADAAPTREIIN